MSHPKCKISIGICGRLTFGTGDLDENGYWEFPCGKCARDFEQADPEHGECWPAPAEESFGTRLAMVKDKE